MSANWTKTRIEIPDNLTPAQRKAFAERVREFIIERSKNGFDKRNRQFKAYSKEYAAKKGQNKVDLTLNDIMLNDLKVISTKKDSILLGYDNGSESNAKAEGNITGSYGKTPNAKHSRDFLGITKKDLKLILGEFK